MLSAIRREIELRAGELNAKVLPSLYFGGGTPSLLSVSEIGGLMEVLQRYYDFSDTAEITLEANPEDLSTDFLKGLVSLGVNRLSVGIQSFFDEDLKLMNRSHSGQQAEAAVKRSQDAGIENLSIDLIYGSPVSDFSQWEANLDRAVALEVPHISSYALTVEPRTALQVWVQKGRLRVPSEGTQNRQFFHMVDVLTREGFEHYEISNFAKKGFRSRHNSAYWNYEPYLGIGPSAHSYDGEGRRSWNVANNAHYLKALSAGELPLEQEFLSEKDRYNEWLMIGLRTADGVDLSLLDTAFSEEIRRHYRKEAGRKLEAGLLTEAQGRLRIPSRHWFMADGIASDLFVL